MKTALIFLAVFYLSMGAKLPPDYKICKGSDDFSNCLKAAIQDALPRIKNGIKDLHVRELQPLNIPSVTIGAGTGAVNVVQKYKDFNIHNVADGTIKKFEGSVSLTELKIDMEYFLPEVKFEADYDLNGRILLLPITGNGKCQVTLKDVTANIKIFGETFEKKGVKYMKIKDFKLELNPGKVIYNFENLFNGDERLGNEMNKVLNDNWKEIFNDVKPGYEEMLQTAFIDYCNQIFSKVPYDDLY